MSSNLSCMRLSEPDVRRFLLAKVHIGTTHLHYHMRSYVYKPKPDGTYIFNIKKTYEKLLLAARAIAAIENPQDVLVIGSSNPGQFGVIKFCHYTGCTPHLERFTAGSFTNRIQSNFTEPRLLIIANPLNDYQPVNESAYCNLPVIAFCNSDTPLRNIDVVIPCNNKGSNAVGLMWWMLTREILRLRGTIARVSSWDRKVVPDLFFSTPGKFHWSVKSSKKKKGLKMKRIAIIKKALATRSKLKAKTAKKHQFKEQKTKEKKEARKVRITALAKRRSEGMKPRKPNLMAKSDKGPAADKASHKVNFRFKKLIFKRSDDKLAIRIRRKVKGQKMNKVLVVAVKNSKKPLRTTPIGKFAQMRTYERALQNISKEKKMRSSKYPVDKLKADKFRKRTKVSEVLKVKAKKADKAKRLADATAEPKVVEPKKIQPVKGARPIKPARPIKAASKPQPPKPKEPKGKRAPKKEEKPKAPKSKLEKGKKAPQPKAKRDAKKETKSEAKPKQAEKREKKVKAETKTETKAPQPKIETGKARAPKATEGKRKDAPKQQKGKAKSKLPTK